MLQFRPGNEQSGGVLTLDSHTPGKRASVLRLCPGGTAARLCRGEHPRGWALPDPFQLPTGKQLPPLQHEKGRKMRAEGDRRQGQPICPMLGGKLAQPSTYQLEIWQGFIWQTLLCHRLPERPWPRYFILLYLITAVKQG